MKILQLFSLSSKIKSKAMTGLDSPAGRAETNEFSGDEDKSSNIIDTQIYILAILPLLLPLLSIFLSFFFLFIIKVYERGTSYKQVLTPGYI